MPFDQGRADAALNFFERVLVHTKGSFANKPFLLMPWQQELIGDLFGTLDEDGCRRYQTAYVELPKKAGKSALAAGVALYCLIADEEPGAEVYSAATSRDQASLVFRVAASMVEKSPILSRRLKVIRSTRTIVHRDDPDTFYRAISADGDVQDGINPHCVIADELHRWKVGKALDLWEILERGTLARCQPLVFAITTAGVQDESPLCWRYHEYARQVREGVFEDRHFYGRVHAADPLDDWTKEETWIKANPSLEANGGYLKLASVRKFFDKAVNDPAQKTEFLRFSLNIWGQAENRAIDMQKWAACGGELRALIDRVCYAGLDLSSTTDLTALTLVFPSDDGTFDILPFFWMAADRVAERELRDKVPYSEWIRKDLIEATPGNTVDYAAVRKKLLWAQECFELREVCYDKWNATQFVTETGNGLMDLGFTCVPIGPGYQSLSEPTKRFLALVLDGKIRHNKHPVLHWNADCLSLKSDGADNFKPAKPNRMSSSKRIDGIVAAIMALARCGQGQSSGPSVYESRGIITL